MDQEGSIKWYLRPVAVILVLFLVLGPFGLPLLYKSPAFTRKWKMILTTLVIIYTVYLVFATLEILRVILTPIVKTGRQTFLPEMLFFGFPFRIRYFKWQSRPQSSQNTVFFLTKYSLQGI